MKIVNCHTTDSKPVKQEVNSTVILPLLVFPAQIQEALTTCLFINQNSWACRATYGLTNIFNMKHNDHSLLLQRPLEEATSGLYCKCVTIVIHNCILRVHFVKSN